MPYRNKKPGRHHRQTRRVQVTRAFPAKPIHSAWPPGPDFKEVKFAA